MEPNVRSFMLFILLFVFQLVYSWGLGSNMRCLTLSPEPLSLTLIRVTQSWRSAKGHLHVVLVNHNIFNSGCGLRDQAFRRCVSVLIDGD